MEFRNFVGWLFVLLCTFCSYVSCVPEDDFFPYGRDVGDAVLPRGDDISSNEFPLKTPIVFYGGRYSSIFVNNNGHLSFGSELPSYELPLTLPLGYKVIAAFFADIDTTVNGTVYYRRVNRLRIRPCYKGRPQMYHFLSFNDFKPTGVFIATWKNVGFYRKNGSLVNTFQIVIASDGRNSFASFHYLGNGINWITSMGKNPLKDDPPAQVGFDSGESERFTRLPYSGKLASDSNVNVPGVWIFHIGPTNSQVNKGNVREPDRNGGR